MDYKGAGDGRVSQKCLKQVSLRLGFASEGWHNDLAQYYYSIFCDGPREIGPIEGLRSIITPFQKPKWKFWLTYNFARRGETVNVRAISGLNGSIRPAVSTIPPVRQVPEGLSRRGFTRTAALGAALGSALWRPAIADPKATFAPVPIPGGTPVLGGPYHVFGPAAFDPIDAEPITITNMNGFVGLAYISGMVTQTDVTSGQQTRYPFLNADMRFMQGNFRGTDGRIHQATFAFI